MNFLVITLALSVYFVVIVSIVEYKLYSMRIEVEVMQRKVTANTKIINHLTSMNDYYGVEAKIRKVKKSDD